MPLKPIHCAQATLGYVCSYVPLHGRWRLIKEGHQYGSAGSVHTGATEPMAILILAAVTYITTACVCGGGGGGCREKEGTGLLRSWTPMRMVVRTATSVGFGEGWG